MTKRKVTPLFAVVLGISSPASAGTEAGSVKPRTLPSGAPACGNAQTKSPRPCTTEARPVPAPVVAAVPRTLPSGAPACGNILGKGGDTRSAAYQLCLAGIDPEALQAGTAVAQRTLVVLGLRDPDPPPPPPPPPTRAQASLTLHHALQRLGASTPRILRDGAPACGNVASRAPRRDCIPRTR